MKKSFVILIVITLSSYSIFAQSNDWIKVKDTLAAYLIEFPGQATKGEQEVSTAKGSVKMLTYTFTPENDVNFVYMTSYSKYPSSFFDNGLDTFESQNTVLNNSVNGAVNTSNGKLLSDKKIVFNGYNGREFIIELSDPDGSNIIYYLHVRTILVGFKIYILQVVSESSDVDNENAKQFFNSFELINIKK